MNQLHLFLAFFRVGMLGYGGGPSAIPLVHKEVVEKYKWMSNQEFADILALANALPGPIATKLAGYIGYRVGGVIGMFNAVLATTVPTIILMILLLTVLSSVKEEPWVLGMTKAVVPVVAVMLGVLTWEFVKQSRASLGLFPAFAFLVGCFIVLQFLHIHPAILIALLLFSALVGKSKKEKTAGKADSPAERRKHS
ncbi:chromate transporter [Saccharococcus caldoxylosilyticus]|uniref:chromate transporter n=1 Tax=Saccharococcus caldoxylosilyticus TaxID=81408 RepID=UPI001FCAF9F8|nr:chromate transporter [Parageobacillus caldoxylosilyticus]BDG37675.1 putative transporter YwrA [Parageobacillus caldoxylosilyticus]BDG41467.1 putative transporter YwrA [Parageobacillus caldoxylosilyticus]